MIFDIFALKLTLRPCLVRCRYASARHIVTWTALRISDSPGSPYMQEAISSEQRFIYDHGPFVIDISSPSGK